jgi:hypothetical protein
MKSQIPQGIRNPKKNMENILGRLSGVQMGSFGLTI